MYAPLCPRGCGRMEVVTGGWRCIHCYAESPPRYSSAKVRAEAMVYVRKDDVDIKDRRIAELEAEVERLDAENAELKRANAEGCSELKGGE